MRWGKNQDWVLCERYVIGPADNPYLIRWRLFECPLFRIYFHRIFRSDDNRHLHDHPWNFVSVILRRGYIEWQPAPPVFPGIREVPECRLALSVVWHRATDLHRIEIDNGPAWTMIFAGRRQREWGFQTERGWLSWREYQENW